MGKMMLDRNRLEGDRGGVFVTKASQPLEYGLCFFRAGQMLQRRPAAFDRMG